MHFDRLLMKLTNKTNTTWNIVKNITNKENTSHNIQKMNINNTESSNPFTIANAFNSYFTSVAENINNINHSNIHSKEKNDPISYLKSNFNLITSQIRLKNTSTYEVNKIIHSLKSKNSHGYDEVSTKS